MALNVDCCCWSRTVTMTVIGLGGCPVSTACFSAVGVSVSAPVGKYKYSDDINDEAKNRNSEESFMMNMNRLN